MTQIIPESCHYYDKKGNAVLKVPKKSGKGFY